MRNTNKNTFSFVTVILITLLCLPIFCFALGNSKSVSTAWNIQPQINNTTSEVKGESLILQKESGTITKMFIYVGNVYSDLGEDSKLSISIMSTNYADNIGSGNNPSTPENIEINIPATDFNSWVEVPLTRTYSNTYLVVTFNDGFEMYEVACFDKEDKFIPVTCYGARVWKKDGKYGVVKAANDDNTFTLACDEQNAFSLTATAKGLSQQELKLAGAISNLLNQDGYYVSESENVLSVLINLPAVVLFGPSSFGLRITGFLFFLATLYLLFFFVKKLFDNNLYAIFAVVLYLVSSLPLSLVTNANGVTIALFFILCSFIFATKYWMRATTAKRVRLNSKFVVLSGALFSLALATSLYSLFILPALATLVIYPSVKGLIETTKGHKEAEGLEKEYMREANSKTWSSVILSLLFGFIAMPFIVLFASYGAAAMTYCEYFEKNLFAVLFANHARIFANQPKGLFLSWILGLGQLEYTFAMGSTVYAFANRFLVFFAFLTALTISILYLLAKCKVIKDGNLLVALRDNQNIFVVINLALASTYLLNAFLWGSNNYASFLITLVFLLLNLPLAHNILKFVLSKPVLKAFTIILLTVVGVFFAFQFVTIFKINLPEKVQPIVNWLIQ